MDPAKFREERLSGIGGSDIHHLFSLLPWGCKHRLYLDKTEQPPDYPQEVSAAMRRGIKLEAAAAEEYEEMTGRKVRRMGIRRLAKKPHIMVHVDRGISPDRINKTAGNLELKCPGREMFWKIKREGLPESHILQLQHSFLVTARKWGSFGIFWAEGWDMLTWDMEPNPRLMQTVEEACDGFWADVQNRKPPAKLKADDRRCQRCPYRLTCQGANLCPQEALVTYDSDTLAPEDQALIALAEAFFRAKELHEEAEDLYTDRLAELKTALESFTVARFPGLGKRIIYRGHTRKGGLDGDKIQKWSMDRLNVLQDWIYTLTHGQPYDPKNLATDLTTICEYLANLPRKKDTPVRPLLTYSI